MNATMPEAPETLEAQMKWLKEGKRHAVLFTSKDEIPSVTPEGFNWVCLPEGDVLYNALYWNAGAIRLCEEHNQLGTVLGYGVNGKPKDAIGAVTIRDRKGVEKQAVVVNAKTHGAAEEVAQARADEDDRVALESCEHVLRKRAGQPLDHLFTVRPLTEVGDLERLKIAAVADGHRPILPSHVIEREGEIIGSAEVGTLPVFMVWLHRDKVRPRESLEILNVLENTLRASRVPVAAMLLAPDSPFVPLMETKLGYQTRGLALLFLKKL